MLTYVVESTVSSFREGERNRKIFDLIFLIFCFCCFCENRELNLKVMASWKLTDQKQNNGRRQNKSWIKVKFPHPTKTWKRNKNNRPWSSSAALLAASVCLNSDLADLKLSWEEDLDRVPPLDLLRLPRLLDRSSLLGTRAQVNGYNSVTVWRGNE